MPKLFPPDMLSLAKGFNLDATILYFVRTRSGKVWAFVTVEEAKDMVALADRLEARFPDPEHRTSSVDDLIDEGALAQGLLDGRLLIPAQPDTLVPADGEELPL